KNRQVDLDAARRSGRSDEDVRVIRAGREAAVVGPSGRVLHVAPTHGRREVLEPATVLADIHPQRRVRRALHHLPPAAPGLMADRPLAHSTSRGYVTSDRAGARAWRARSPPTSARC